MASFAWDGWDSRFGLKGPGQLVIVSGSQFPERKGERRVNRVFRKGWNGRSVFGTHACNQHQWISAREPSVLNGGDLALSPSLFIFRMTFVSGAGRADSIGRQDTPWLAGLCRLLWLLLGEVGLGTGRGGLRFCFAPWSCSSWQRLARSRVGHRVLKDNSFTCSCCFLFAPIT